MANNIRLEEGKVISVYVSKEVSEHLSAVGNVSEYIRNLILEATDAGDKVKVAQEKATLEVKRAKLAGEIAELDALITKANDKLDKLTHDESFYNEQRRVAMEKWREVPGYHGNFWPNLSWFESRMDVVQECGFKSPEEATNWFNDRRPIRRI